MNINKSTNIDFNSFLTPSISSENDKHLRPSIIWTSEMDKKLIAQHNAVIEMKNKFGVSETDTWSVIAIKMQLNSADWIQCKEHYEALKNKKRTIKHRKETKTQKILKTVTNPFARNHLNSESQINYMVQPILNPSFQFNLTPRPPQPILPKKKKKTVETKTTAPKEQHTWKEFWKDYRQELPDVDSLNGEWVEK